MASLAAAHKGYLYQDIATAYFLAKGLVEPVQSITVDAKFHANDRFDDLLVFEKHGRRTRRQFKHSESAMQFDRSCLSSDSHDLRLDLLIKSWQADPPNVRAKEYRVCVTWRQPTAKENRQLLTHSTAPSLFDGQSRCFQLAVDVIWPPRQPPAFKCLRSTNRSDLLNFAKRFVIELECPRASLDLARPGPMEDLLLHVLEDRVGFGRYPNERRSPLAAAAQLILHAYKTRGADFSNSTLTPEAIASDIGLVTDYGRIAQQFPFKSNIFVSLPELRRHLLSRVKAGGITILSGGPGAGKSWELTDLMKKLRAQGTIVASHYCYLEPGDPQVQSRITLNAFYGNIIAEIIDAEPRLRDANPTRYAAGPMELQGLLNAAAKLQPAPRLVVIVDGLDHIARVLRDSPTISTAETQIARGLLALKLPKNVSVLIGSQPGDHITKLARSGTVLTVPAWEEPEVEAFLGRIPLGTKLPTQRVRREDRHSLIAELTLRSQGNPLYCTYLCRELETRLDANPGAAPLTLLRALPANDGQLSTYYEFLLGSLDSGGKLVGEVMGLIDFGVTPAEIQEIFPLLHGRVEEFLRQLAPILEQTRGQGGVRIYHESFRRHLLDKVVTQPGSLREKLKDVIVWLEKRGFFTDARAFRFLLPNLVRAERANEVLALVDRDFVVRSVVEGQTSRAIDTNLELYARVAADAQDFPKLVRAAELARALGTCNDNLSDAYEYATTYAAIYGANRLADRLTFDGAPTFKVPDGLKLCSFCADAGASPPWHAYLRKRRPSEENQDMRAEMAYFHGLVRTDEGGDLRVRLIAFLSKAKENIDDSYIASLAQRWAEAAGPDDLPRLKRVSKCNDTVAEIFDLEFARRTKRQRLRKAAANRVALRTGNAERAIEALRLGADPRMLSHWANDLDKHDIGIGGRGIGEGYSLQQWVCGIRIAAYVQPKLLTVESIRTRGDGWYRNWLAFVITLARIERGAVRSPQNASDEVVEALRALAVDVEPFKGKPRACDLYYARATIHASFRTALGLLQSLTDWHRALVSLKKISSGTTTYLDNSQSGPLTPSALFELVAPFAKRPELQKLIRSEIEPVLQNQHHSNLYCAIASDEMSFASLLVTMGDKPAALEHWKSACLNLCAYGMRKDITIYEVLDSVRALSRAGKPHVLDRVAKLLPMIYAVVLHTDGRETRHSIGKWFDELAATDSLVAAWLLGRSMTDGGGSYDYHLEDALVHWLESAGDFAVRCRCRLEQVVEGPAEETEIKRRIARIETLRTHDAPAAQLEFQLLSAAAHGDPVQFSKANYALLQDCAARNGFALPAGNPDISYPVQKDSPSSASPDPPTPKLRWKSPRHPAALLRRLQDVLHSKEISNQQLLDYCRTPFVEWGKMRREELEEILIVIARSNRFGDRANLLSGLGTALESAGMAELAASALTLAFAGNRGGGGWLSFGDEEHEDLLERAFRASRPVALSVLAHEMAHRLGNWGVTSHVIGFLGRHDDVSLASAMWDEARDAIAFRLPGFATAVGPFLPLEPAKVPVWSHEDAALFLILARISHPERRRKTAALCNAAWLVQQESARCIAGFREILKASLPYTQQVWLLQLLDQFEPQPFPISQALAAELNGLVCSGKFGTEQLALKLLNRANVHVTALPARARPIVSVTPSPNRVRAIMSLDVHDVVPRVEEMWPGFPDIAAGRFETVRRSDEVHEVRIKARWKACYSIARKTFPPASLHGWEDELFSECLHEVLTGLEAHLWSEGEWDERICPQVLSLLLPSAEIPARHAWSRRVRPSWPLPSGLAEGTYPVPTVPDGESSGWCRIAYIETYLDCDSRIDEIKLRTRATAGVVLGDKVTPLPKDAFPLREGDYQAWLRPTRPRPPLDSFSGVIAGYSVFGTPFDFHPLLGLAPALGAALELVPRSEIGPLDLFDKEGKLAVAYRWWRCRPLGDHSFAEETPRLSGGALFMRPDLLAQLVAATKLHAFEAISLNVKTTEQLLAEQQGS